MNYQTEKLNIIELGAKNGSTPALVFLHGWGHSTFDLKPLAELLSEHERALLIDLPGFGASPAPDTSWGTKEYADCVLKALDGRGIQQFTLVGHSLGGRISLQISSRFPERVAKMVLINSHGLKPVRSWYQEIRIRSLRIAAKWLKVIDSTFKTKFFVEWFAPRFGSRDYKNASSTMRSTFVKIVNEDLSDALKRISAPTLLLWGENDKETPVALGRKIHQGIKDSIFLVLKGKGHEPFRDVGSHLLAYHMKHFLGADRTRQTAS